ncbi:kelch-like protein 3 [Glandiceps talaboti]
MAYQSQSYVSNAEFYSDLDHGRNLLEKIDLQRSNMMFCDVVVRAGKQDFQVHRNVLAASSPYFEAMFCSGLCESKQTVVTVTCTSPSAIGQILDYMYTGIININHDNVEDVIAGADHLLMPVLKAHCADYLQNNIDNTNCLGFRELADIYCLDDLIDAANSIIRRNFEDVINAEEVLNHSIEGVIALVSDPEIILSNESCIFELVVRWVKYDYATRKNYLPRLISIVRLLQLDHNYLKERVERERIIAESPQCKEIIGKCMQVNMGSRVRYTSGIPYHDPHYQPRPGTLFNVIVVTSEHPSATFGYVINENRWVELAPMPINIRNHSSAELHGRLYVLGGENRDVTSKVHCYDPLTNTWHYIREMLSPVWAHCALACNGLLYVFGMRVAHDGAMLQSYDPELDAWQYVAPMRLHVRPLFAYAKDDTYIYLMGGDDGQMKRYDTINKSWLSLPPLPSKTRRLWTLSWVPLNGNEAYITDFENVYVKFNADRKSWQQEMEIFPKVPSKAYCFTSCVVKKDIYIFGGCTETFYESGLSDCFVYNTMAYQWKRLAVLPKPLMNLKHEHVRSVMLKIPYKFLQ